MDFLFKNRKIELWRVNTNTTALTVYDLRLARRINKLLKDYYSADFIKYDEPTFKVNASQLAYIASNEPFLAKILRQLGGPDSKALS